MVRLKTYHDNTPDPKNNVEWIPPMTAFIAPLLEKTAGLLLSAARFGAFYSYPLSFERLEIDENTSFWVTYTPDYRPNPSLQGDTEADLAIIGGGFTGVSTAYHFSQRYPEKRVVLLEAKSLANGASGRNGGMMLNWINGVDDPDDETLINIYAATNGAIDMIVDIIQKHQLQVSYRRDGAMVNYTDPARAEQAHAYSEKLNSLGIPTRFIGQSELAEVIHLHGAYGAVIDDNEGQLNGAQFIRALKPVLEAQGVQIYENTPATKVEEGRTITLTTPQGQVRAKAIVLATNGYTGKLGYFRKAIFPLHSHVFATAPLSPAQQREVGWHGGSGYSDDYDRISYSTLTREGNIVFGGGSNASYAYLFNNRTAYPGTPATAQRGFRKMEETMHAYLPALRNIPITHRWTGTLAISLRRNMSYGVMGENRNIYYSLGYCGHGVTMANLAGKILTDIYSGDDAQWRKLPPYQSAFTPLPLEPLRWLGYQMMTTLTGKSPRV
jgi:glycine/D-amino acid oxidase-like deaminating enzyme